MSMFRNVSPKLAVSVLLVVAAIALTAYLIYYSPGASVSESPMTTIDPRGPAADLIQDIYALVWWLALAVFIIVEGLLVFAIVKYRGRSTKGHGSLDRPKPVHGNTRLEIVWTIIPALILVVIAIPTLAGIAELAEEPGDDALVVNVIGKQFFWEFEYPEYGFTVANEMHIPVGREIDIRLHSGDVIHSFWVPQLNGKMDAIPAKENRLWLEANEAGTYMGQCAEFCGLSHALMLFTVVAEPDADFAAWVDSIQNPPDVDPIAAGQLILEQKCAACHKVEGTTAQGVVGPELTGFGDQPMIAGILENTPENLAAWLADPQAIKPGTAMPNLGLTEQEITNLVAYLESLTAAQ
jgi:cytochrome c oxidase subunit 2